MSCASMFNRVSSYHIVVVALLFFCILGHSTIGYSCAKEPVVEEPVKKEQDFKQRLKDQWGIVLTTLRMTASDRMIDFRYRVVDGEKAAPLQKRQVKPYLVHQKSGKVLVIPKTNQVSVSNHFDTLQQGGIYWIFFGNDSQVKRGDKVSVVIGDFREDGIIVN